MSSEWYHYLGDTGVRIENGLVLPLSSPQEEAESAATETLFSPLTYLGVIRISGEDAATFLQNQFTSDIREVDESHSQLSAWCSPKGRVLACFRLFRREHEYYMLLPREMVGVTLERLRKYILISRVTLEDATARLTTIGIGGPAAEGLLTSLVGTPPSRPDEAFHHPEGTLLRIPGAQPRYLLVAEVAETATMERLWSALCSQARLVGSGCWRLLDIQAGLPSIYLQTAEAFLPQMINLEALGGLSFEKGCYPGQEVVARMQYLGKLKRRMYHVRTKSQFPLAPGDPICAIGDSRTIGKVVDAQTGPDGNYEMLVVLEIATVAAGEESCLAEQPHIKLELLELPYQID